MMRGEIIIASTILLQSVFCLALSMVFHCFVQWYKYMLSKCRIIPISVKRIFRYLTVYWEYIITITVHDYVFSLCPIKEIEKANI